MTENNPKQNLINKYMREIKFRAWNKEDKKMFSVISLNFCADGHLIVMGKDGGVSTPYCELMQFTGLKDKNGKEIYEGDIIGHKNPDWLGGFQGKWEVKFGESTCDEYCEETVGYRQISKDEEIIGNIYENPNLLKRKHFGMV